MTSRAADGAQSEYASSEIRNSQAYIRPTSVLSYRLGLRLREALLVTQFASSSAHIALACRLLRDVDAVFEELRQSFNIDRPEWFTQLRGAFTRSHEALFGLIEIDVGEDAWCRVVESTSLNLAEVGELGHWLTRNCAHPELPWFELGQMIVPEPNFPVNRTIPVVQVPAAIHWPNQDQRDQLLDAVGLRLEHLFIEPNCDDEEWYRSAGEFPEPLWPLYYVERGLERIFNSLTPPTNVHESDHSEPNSTSAVEQIRRPAFSRDHHWLNWYDDATAVTHRRPAEIRDKWNRMSQQQREQIAPRCSKAISLKGKGCAVVEAGLKRARLERDNFSNAATIDRRSAEAD